MTVRFLRLSYFIWLIVPVTILLLYLIFGMPHMIWSYSWIDEGQGYDPFATRHYTRCTYVGPYGNFTEHPNNGKCGWVRFRKQREQA